MARLGGPLSQLGQIDRDRGVRGPVSHPQCLTKFRSLAVPLRCEEASIAAELTSKWLHQQIEEILLTKLRSLDSAARCELEQLICKEQPVSLQNMNNLPAFTLSSLNGELECVDFFLTQADEPLANFLNFGKPFIRLITYVFLEEKLRINFHAADHSKTSRRLSKLGNSIPSIKDFKFLKVLGKGGFATVYMVRHNPTGKLYAMKCVKKPLSAQAAEQV